jgi:hypothetical protein
MSPASSRPDNPFNDFLASPPLASSNQLAANTANHGMNDPFADSSTNQKKPVSNAYDMDAFFDE